MVIGPNPQIPGYGVFTFQCNDGVADYFLPWIPVQQVQLLVPVPRSLSDELQPIVSPLPGFVLTVTQIDVRDLESFPFP